MISAETFSAYIDKNDDDGDIDGQAQLYFWCIDCKLKSS